MKQLLVIGGGISGASAARLAAERGYQVQVIEANARLGGCLHSMQNPHGDTVGELGGHTVYNSYGGLIQLLKPTPLWNRHIAREPQRFHLWHENQAIKVTKKLHKGALIWGLLRWPWQQRKGQAVGPFYQKLFGTDNYQQVIRPALSAVVSQPCDQFAADHLFNRRPRDKNLPRSFSFTEGLESMVDELFNHANIEVISQQTVGQLRYQQGWFADTEEDTYQAQQLFLALPAGISQQLLQGVDDKLAQQLANIGQQSVHTLGMITPSEHTTLPKVAGLFGAEAPFYSLVSSDSMPSKDGCRAFALHGATPPDDQLMSQLTGADPAHWSLQKRTQHTLPRLAAGHQQWCQDTQKLLQDSGLPLMIGGNFWQGLAIEDCVQRSMSELARGFED